MKYLAIIFSALFFACSTNSSKDVEEKQVENAIVVTNDTCTTLYIKAKQTDEVLMRATNFSKQQAELAIVDFMAYTSVCKNDTLTPVFLIKSAQLAQSINNFQKAEAYLKQCITEHDRYPNRGAAMFLLAQLYDDANKLNNETEAKMIYQSILKEYPNSDWAKDAKSAISNLGKSDEQLIEEFLKKNK